LEVAGKARVFSFKRSVIEGQDIGEEDAYKVIDLIRKLIEKKTT
jgi:hypothetical protein